MERASVEDMALPRLAHRLKWLDSLIAHGEEGQWSLAAPNSELEDDDRRTRPYSTSHAVGHCLSTTVDHFRGARKLLSNPEDSSQLMLPFAAQYPMLRSAMECGAVATWLLADDDADVRVSRSLRLAWQDVLDDNNMVLALTAPVVSDSKEEVVRKNKLRQQNNDGMRKEKKLIKGLAAAAGIPELELFRGRGTWVDIIEEAAVSAGIATNWGVGMWRLVSGLTHPSPSRMRRMSDVELLDSEESDTIRARFTAKPALVNTAVEAAILMHVRALELAAQRGSKPDVAWSLPPEFPLPPGWVGTVSYPS